MAELVALAKTTPGGFSYGTSGVGGAAHLAAELLQSITKALNLTLADPGVADAMRKLGYEPIFSTPQELADRIRLDLVKWNKVIKDAKIQLE